MRPSLIPISWFVAAQSERDDHPGLSAELSQLGFEGGAGIITSEEYCELMIWPAAPPHPVTTGNISVR